MNEETPTERDEPPKLCPSAKAEEGAILLGIVGSDGRVGYVWPRMTVNADFVDRASAGRSPDSRFRFAQPCVESACGHWSGTRCELIELGLGLQARSLAPEPSESLPRCSIRAQCRWFAQAGPRACGVCPYVIADAGPDGSVDRVAHIPPSPAALESSSMPLP